LIKQGIESEKGIKFLFVSYIILSINLRVLITLKMLLIFECKIET